MKSPATLNVLSKSDFLSQPYDTPHSGIISTAINKLRGTWPDLFTANGVWCLIYVITLMRIDRMDLGTSK